MGQRQTWVTILLGVVAVVVPPLARGAPPDQPALGHPCKPCGQEQAGYWIVPVTDGCGRCQLRVEPYYPQPGDIFLYDNFSKTLSVMFRAIGTRTPIHAAIAIERPDHTPAILEVGPNSRPRAFTETAIVDVFPRLASYPGGILVRRLRQPLSPEQSAALTQFAQAQEGKKFAVGRLFLQGTPFRCRSGLRYWLFAHTDLNRDRWICSENVVAAATIAGLLDPKRYPANAMYPGDLAYDERYDLSAVYHVPVLWVADAHPQIEGNHVQVDVPERKK